MEHGGETKIARMLTPIDYASLRFITMRSAFSRRMKTTRLAAAI